MLSQAKGELTRSLEYLKQAESEIPADPTAANALRILNNNLIALNLVMQQNPAGAEPYAREAKTFVDNLLAGDDLVKAEVTRNLGAILVMTGKYSEAEPLLDRKSTV